MGTILTVSTKAALYNALSHAKGGETIQLAAGSYGNLSLTDMAFHVASNVTITSADPLHPASFSGLMLDNVSNLTLDGVVCNYTFKPGDPLYAAPFSVNGGHDVTIRNSTFDGDVASGMTPADNGYGTGAGLTITNTTNTTVEGNEISSFYRGLTVSDSTGATIRGNDVHDIRSDGMDFVQVQGLTVEGNHIHDFRTAPDSGDHPDMIQFWTAGTTAPSTDVVIRGNVLDMGNGTWTQTIFLGNEVVSQGLAGSEMYYRNITIEDNVIVNGQSHGITVTNADGVIIQHNTVLHSDGTVLDGADSSVEIPKINVSEDSLHVVITGNVTGGITGWTGQSGWTVGQNALVQDQDANAPGYYADVFITSSLTAQDGLHDILARPGGMVDLLGAGAPLTREFLPPVGEVAALFQMTADDSGALQTRVFDASLCLSDKGTLPQGAVYEWTFGDGTTAQGLKVVHNFATPGHYGVSLTIRLPNGAHDTVQGVIGIQNGDILALGPDGLFHATDFENTIILPGGPGASSDGIHLGASGVAATIGSEYATQILQTHDFDITMQIDAATTGSTGEVFRLHGGLLASITAKGEVSLQATSTTGAEVTLTSTGVSVTNLKSHDVDIRLHDGQLQLWVDGKLSAQAAFAGMVNSFGPTDLTFGNPWGGKNFTGDLSAFDITVGENGPNSVTILSLGTDGQFHNSAAPSGQAAPDLVTSGQAAPIVAGLHLGEGSTRISVSDNNLTDLLNTRDFDVGMTLDADSAASAGVIFRLPNGLAARVLPNGQIAVRAFGDAGSTLLTSTSTPFSDLKSHDVDIRLHDGKLQLWIDHTLSTEAGFSGTLANTRAPSLNFGVTQDALNFHGTLTTFEIAVGYDNSWTPVL